MTTIPPPSPSMEAGRLPRPQKAPDQTGVMRWLPGLYTLRHYDPAWLRDDIVAGLVLTTMLVPVGIAYAVASGVPGIYGLYATIIPLLAYADNILPLFAANMWGSTARAMLIGPAH
jgi:Sulfate permease family